MERLLIVGGLFLLAGLCEIGGGYLVWGWMRDLRGGRGGDGSPLIPLR